MRDPDLEASVQHTIEVLRRDAAKAKNGADRLEAALNALALWRIQSLERIGWALEAVADNAPDQPSRQAELWFYLAVAREHCDVRGEAGWSVTWVPTDLHEELLEALAALPFGEVQPILERGKTRQHGASYSAGIARLLAVEHVEFLAAKGYKKGKALTIVSSALGEEEGTVRSWKDTLLPKAIGKARLRKALATVQEAGRLAEALADPEGALTVNADVLAAYERHEGIDLQSLGRDLRQTR